MANNKTKTANAKPKLSSSPFFKYPYLLIVLLPLLIYSPSIKNGYVYFDDDILILENQKKLINTSNIVKAFQTDAFFNKSSPYYRPLLNVSFILDAQISKADPWFYHFMNIAYHILTCCLIFYLLGILGFNKQISLVSTLLFSVHPLMAGTVFWIPARNDLLVTLFSLLFLITSILWLQKRKSAFLIASLFSYGLALFSKESGVILPILLILHLYFTKQLKVDKGKIVFFAAIGLITAAWYILRNSAIAYIGMTQVGFWAIKANYAFPFEIIAKLIIPVNIAVTPIYSAFYTITGVILSIVLLGIFLIRKPEKYQLPIFGLIWYILFSLPNMFVRLDTSPDSYDYLTHRAYLPVIGLLIALITIFNETEVESKYIKIKRIAIFLVLILYSGSSISLSKKYSDSTTFWTSSIERNPQKAWFHYFLGRYYFKQKDFIAFELHIRRAISIKAHPQFLYNLGMIYFTEKKSYDSAFILFNQARATGFTDPEANNNYIRLCNESARDYYEKGEYKKAADRCQIAVDLDPENAICTFNLGLYLMYCDQTKKAATLWRRSIELDPKLKESYRNLYYYYLNNSQNKDSIEYYRVKFISNGGTF